MHITVQELKHIQAGIKKQMSNHHRIVPYTVRFLLLTYLNLEHFLKLANLYSIHYYRETEWIFSVLPLNERLCEEKSCNLLL